MEKRSVIARVALGGGDDPGLERQRAPSHFKLARATRPTCGEVAACLR